MEKIITVTSELDAAAFRRFGFFDAFVVKRHWRGPALFSLILIAFAAAALWAGKEQSGLIAAVLLAVGLGLPLIYAGAFLGQLNRQAARFGLGRGRRIYTVALGPEGVTVHNLLREEKDLRLVWSDIWRVYRRNGCIYLYAAPSKAFLLPEGRADAPDHEVLEILGEKLDRSRLFL